VKSPDELRASIAKARRITRDADVVAIIDALEEILDRPPSQAEALWLKRRAHGTEYMRDYRRGLRRKKKYGKGKDRPGHDYY
jgi:hypothetical protein